MKLYFLICDRNLVLGITPERPRRVMIDFEKGTWKDPLKNWRKPTRFGELIRGASIKSGLLLGIYDSDDPEHMSNLVRDVQTLCGSDQSE